MSFDFPGNADCFVNRGNIDLNFQPPLTWSCWIIPDTLPKDQGVNYYGANSPANKFNSGFMFYFPNNSTVAAYVRATNPIAWVSKATGNLTAGTLYHLCATCYTAGNTIYIDFYVNGTLYQVNSTGTSPRGINYEDATVYFRVGKYATTYFDGKIEDFAIWNVRLNEVEILQLYNSYKKRMPLMIQPANLQVYWPLDDYSPGITNIARAIDMSANGRNAGSVTGGASIVARESIMRGGII